MLEIVLSLTVPFSVLLALADDVLYEFRGLAFAVPPLLAAAAPAAVALALPLELLFPLSRLLLLSLL